MLKVLSNHKCFGGNVSYWKHKSNVCKTEMKFAIYEPPQIKSNRLPVLYYLSGLTCTEETFMIKSGGLKVASELGIILVSSDTSPRNLINIDENNHWDFGTGAGFYLDATKKPWSENFKMFSYVTEELPKLIKENFNANSDKQSIFGHSMGGHGALICALKRPDLYKSISAFAPISSPSISPWGIKAFKGYLGDNKEEWKKWDALDLIEKNSNLFDEILIDQGKNDEFLNTHLFPEKFINKCKEVNQNLNFRLHDGYDHGYNFISTFIEDHINFHASRLLI